MRRGESLSVFCILGETFIILQKLLSRLPCVHESFENKNYYDSLQRKSKSLFADRIEERKKIESGALGARKVSFLAEEHSTRKYGCAKTRLKLKARLGPMFGRGVCVREGEGLDRGGEPLSSREENGVAVKQDRTGLDVPGNRRLGHRSVGLEQPVCYRPHQLRFGGTVQQGSAVQETK